MMCLSLLMAWVCLERLCVQKCSSSRLLTRQRLLPAFRQHHAKGHRVPTRVSSCRQGPDTPQVGEFLYFNNFLCCVCLLYFTSFTLQLYLLYSLYSLTTSRCRVPGQTQQRP